MAFLKCVRFQKSLVFSHRKHTKMNSIFTRGRKFLLKFLNQRRNQIQFSIHMYTYFVYIVCWVSEKLSKFLYAGDTTQIYSIKFQHLWLLWLMSWEDQQDIEFGACQSRICPCTMKINHHNSIWDIKSSRTVKTSESSITNISCGWHGALIGTGRTAFHRHSKPHWSGTSPEADRGASMSCAGWRCLWRGTVLSLRKKHRTCRVSPHEPHLTALIHFERISCHWPWVRIQQMMVRADNDPLTNKRDKWDSSWEKSMNHYHQHVQSYIRIY